MLQPTVLLAVFASGRITALVVGLVAAASPFVIILANIINKPIELSINRYYTNDAKKMLAACPNLTVIGVTGSYGKTSVKFYLNTLLKAKYNVLMTPELQHSNGRRQDRCAVRSERRTKSSSARWARNMSAISKSCAI